jgi:hypothetical protein
LAFSLIYWHLKSYRPYRFQGRFDKFQQYFAGFNRLFTVESVSFCHRIDDVSFCESARYWHFEGLLSRERLDVNCKGLICQLKNLVIVYYSHEAA